MSDHDALFGRIGRLDCVCAETEGAAQRGLYRLAAGFGLSVLAQALILSALPVSAAASAPSPSLAGAPYALFLAGSALATFPAAFLADSMGRRGAFSLGAGLGVAGGALAGWAAAQGQFVLLCLGAFWLGAANGFALFYRHAAAASARDGALVLGGGVLAALLAPALLEAAAAFGPFADRQALFMAGAVNLLALGVTITLPHGLRVAPPPSPLALRPFVLATTAGAVAWFIMSATMAQAAPGLVGCGGQPATVGGLIAWHLLAMYAPALAAPWLQAKASRATVLWLGLACLALGAALFGVGRAPDVARIELVGAGLAFAGVGWALANAGALRFLHDGGRPARGALALHDFVLLAAAMAGALAGPALY